MKTKKPEKHCHSCNGVWTKTTGEIVTFKPRTRSPLIAVRLCKHCFKALVLEWFISKEETLQHVINRCMRPGVKR